MMTPFAFSTNIPTLPETNSTVYWLAVNPVLPDLIIANSMYGYLYVSSDGGDSWRKLRRELSEIRALACMPN
jgi:hypothetical protein